MELNMLTLSDAQMTWVKTAIDADWSMATLGYDDELFVESLKYKVNVTRWPNGAFTIATWE